MVRPDKVFGGMLLGAGLMYFLDPVSGRRRRALVRDQLVHGVHEVEDAAHEGATRVVNRTRGMVAETRNRLMPQDVDDSVLEARVRSEMGHVIQNTGAVAVRADNGVVTLSGPVLSDDVQELVKRVRSVPGVDRVVDDLDVHETPDSIAGLQGPGFAT